MSERPVQWNEQNGSALLQNGVFFQRRQTDWTEKARVKKGPVRSIERAVASVDDVGVVKIFPFDLAAIEIRDAISGEVSDFDLQSVFARLEELADGDLERGRPKSAEIMAIERDAGAF